MALNYTYQEITFKNLGKMHFDFHQFYNHITWSDSSFGTEGIFAFKHVLFELTELTTNKCK